MLADPDPSGRPSAAAQTPHNTHTNAQQPGNLVFVQQWLVALKHSSSVTWIGPSLLVFHLVFRWCLI